MRLNIILSLAVLLSTGCAPRQDNLAALPKSVGDHSVMPILSGESCLSVMELDFTNAVYPDPEHPAIGAIQVYYSYVPAHVDESHGVYGSVWDGEEFQRWRSAADYRGSYLDGKAALRNGERTKQICLHGSFDRGSNLQVEIYLSSPEGEGNSSWVNGSGSVNLPIYPYGMRYDITSVEWWGGTQAGTITNIIVPLKFSVNLHDPVNTTTE